MELVVAEGTMTPVCRVSVPALSSLFARATLAAPGTRAPRAWPVSPGCWVSLASGDPLALKVTR